MIVHLLSNCTSCVHIATFFAALRVSSFGVFIVFAFTISGKKSANFVSRMSPLSKSMPEASSSDWGISWIFVRQSL